MLLLYRNRRSTENGPRSPQSKLIYINMRATPRTAFLLNIKYSFISEFIQQNIVAIMVEVPTARGKQQVARTK